VHPRNEKEMENVNVALSVPRSQVKRVKTALEAQNVLNRATKISRENASDPKTEARMTIYTTIPFAIRDHKIEAEHEPSSQLEMILADLSLLDLQPAITLSPSLLTNTDTSSKSNPLLKGLRTALNALPHEILLSLNLSIESLYTSFPTSYSVYKPMLLLPPNTFTSSAWTILLSAYSPTSTLFHELWETLAIAIGTTHIALNAGIPLQNSTSETSSENILRSPTNLTPLYGSFGPLPSPQTISKPTVDDFRSALWVTHAQNGIHQTWTPLYTMFSRGNIREKTRLLTLPSILSAVSEGKGKSKIVVNRSSVTNPRNATHKSGCTAVDLYAGIGYFAFPYKRAGVSKILCWELNPWSVEGLRRGAILNKWTTQIFTDRPSSDTECTAWMQSLKNVDFLVFQRSNEEAFAAIMALKGRCGQIPPLQESLPPIRHVNCGFLPSSRACWATAVKIIDDELGGWVHAHENVGVSDVEKRREAVVAEMQRYLDRWEAEKGCCGSYRRRVRCEHVERVKTYAPGVLHVVFDVWVGGVTDAEDRLA
jgi:tRNA wybutosine-synthesizing protein 2